MSVLENHFYNNTITTYTSVFGSIFNDIKIKRTDGKIIDVPIAYSLKQKYHVRNSENPVPNSARYKMILPRLGFQLMGVTQDPIRRTNKLQRSIPNKRGSSAQYNRVPYIYQYQLYIKTQNIDDLWQIVEQILFYFNPTVRVRVKDNKAMSEDSIIAVKLTNSGIDTIAEGLFEDTQTFEVTMDFELEGWMYGPTTDATRIHKINIKFFDYNKPDILIDEENINATQEEIDKYYESD